MDNLENYKKDLLTIDLGFANAFALLLIIPVGIIFGLPFYWIWGWNIDTVYDEPLLMAFAPLIVLVGGIILHELIHGMIWAAFAKKGFKSIKFGILLKMFTPYCHCKEPLKVKYYILGAIMPGIVLGIIPAIVAVCIGMKSLLIAGMFFTMAAGGDILIINLLRNENMNDYAQDHPSEAGCYIYRKS